MNERLVEYPSTNKEPQIKESTTKVTNSEGKLLNNYRTEFEYSSSDFLILSTKGKLFYHVEGELNHLFGNSLTQHISYKDLFPKKDHQILEVSFNQATQGLSTQKVITIKNKSNDTLFINVKFHPIKNKANNIVGVLLVIEDVTKHKKLEDLYRLQSRYFEYAQQIADLGSFEYIIKQDTMNCSQKIFDIFGIESSQSVSMETFSPLIHKKDFTKVNNLMQQAIHNGESYQMEYRINHGFTGELRYIKEHIEVVKENNQPSKVIGVAKDITERRRLEDDLIESNKHFQHIFDHLNVGIWMRESLAGDLIFASKGLAEILQISLETLYNQPKDWEGMALPMYKDELFEKYELLLKGEQISHMFRINAGDGTTKWIHEQTIPKLNEQGEVTHLFGMIRDISSEVELQSKLEFLAKNNVITSLPNQQALYEKLDELVLNEQVQTFALLYMDLDDFFWVTDSLGYPVGDKVLKRLSNKLIELLPKGAFLANLNYDNFIFVIPDYSSKKEITRLAETIIKCASEKLVVSGYEVFITVSIGISFYPENGSDKLSLIESSHAALYYAKNIGKNNFQIYSSYRDIDVNKNYILERDLRYAIEKKEFEVYYQPQVNPQNGAIEGAEALIRWNHQNWGTVSPGEFIPLAEHKHIIHEIGEWMIEQVCCKLKKWKDQGRSIFPVSVNVSPIQFLKKGLVENVEENLKKYDIPAEYLELEITENTFMKNEKTVQSTIKQLKRIGVKVSLDDFGTGYSSLNYLRKFNLDILKIDQSFIQHIDLNNNEDTAIVSAILDLGKAMGMRVIAEGVEKPEQMEFLKEKECDLLQGFLYSKPVSAEKFEQMLEIGYIHLDFE